MIQSLPERLSEELAAILRDMVAAILEDKEAHVDWLETQRELLDQMGLSNYLQYLARGLD